MQATTAIPRGKFRSYASVKEVLHRAFHELGGFKRVGDLIRARKSKAYRFTDPNSTADLGFAAVCELVRCGSRAPVEYLCALAGGAFHPGEQSNEDLDSLAVRCLQRNTGFLAAVIGKGDPREQLREIDDLMRAAGSARAHIIAQIEIH